MAERPILFSGPMVRAILEGRKTQTRRVVTLKGVDGVQKDHSQWRFCEFHDDPRRAVWQGVDVLQRVITEVCPYGVPGDRLWVRETFRYCVPRQAVEYRADGSFGAVVPPSPVTVETGRSFEWTPSIFMPRWASRITLEITDVRVQRLQEISEEDAEAEGIKIGHTYCDEPDLENDDPDDCGVHRCNTPSDDYRILWDSINAKRHPWSSNPWVWAITFRRLP